MSKPPEDPRNGAERAAELAVELDAARRELRAARGPLGAQRVLCDALERALPSFDPDALARAVESDQRPEGLDAAGWLFATALLECARAGAASGKHSCPPSAEQRDLILEELLWSLAQAVDEESLCRVVLEAVREHLQAERVSLVRPVGDGDVLEVLALAGTGGRLVAGTRLPRERSGVGAIFETGEGSYRAIDRHSDCLEDDVLRAAGLRTTLGVPVRCGGPVLAVLNVSTTRVGGFEPEDQALLTRMGQLFGAFWLAWCERRDAHAARLRAEEASRHKSDFLATMSHEIRTPMNGILGLASLLAESDLPPAAAEHAQTIHHSCEALLAIVNDVLDWSKIEAGKLDFESREFSLGEALEGTLRLFESAAEAKGVALVAHLSDNLPTGVIGDVARLQQVLNNLISNAIKFTAEGQVTLGAQRLPSRPGRVRLEFSVADTGIGIPDAVQEQVFEPFTQADASVNREFGGTGLGLAISRRLVLAQGGHMAVESEFGSGAVFRFTLEFGEAAELERPEAEAPSGERDLAHLRVLVAEDHPINQRVALALLGRLGVQAEVAADGVEALQAVESGAFDVVLMDLAMPRMDGFEAAERIQALALDPRPSIVACTFGGPARSPGARRASPGGGLNEEALLSAVKRRGAPEVLPVPRRLPGNGGGYAGSAGRVTPGNRGNPNSSKGALERFRSI
ncbi:MAG: sensor histidine kinase [Planctomycetota bacterium]|jgi:signal transduction histidine kinase